MASIPDQQDAAQRPAPAGYELVGPSAVGELVRAPDGTVLLARRCSRPRAAAALRSGLADLPPHDHRETLVDLADEDGDAVVLLTRPAVIDTLAGLVTRGRVLTAGAAVTVLAPIAAALRDAQEHGVLVAVDAGTVGLTAQGRPVLLLTGGEGATTAPAEALRRLMLVVRPQSPPPPTAELAELEAHLYRSAVPAPLGDLLAPPIVATAPEEEGAGPPVAATALDCARRALLALTRRRREAPRRPRSRTRDPAAAAPDGGPARHRRVHPLDGWRRRVLTVVSARRGPLLSAAVVVVGALVASLATQGGGQSARSAAADDRGGASARPSTSSPASPAPPGPDTPAGDAATALLRAAAACTATGGVSCLRSLTTDDSPLRSEGASDYVASLGLLDGAVLTDTHGATALVEVGLDGGTTAASVLIIRTEAGWLLREVFTE
ncbi:hypothetical protein NB037_13680 [Rathayibacter sp. ZW T2_19]|uniref:Uncharacterized protein n=1 Tax=Rathayibacter rubneri TaxID=2950106 RepID=A0A9X2E335_9MICO|nr:hypothetical protein [Rathayibacter rubneri]MCM6763471.1 hypothetical protein [Rathayibacter rubneri]